MEKMEFGKEFEGKRVYIKLKTGRIYTGRVIVYENHFYKIIDKFGSRIIISEDEVLLIQEERK